MCQEGEYIKIYCRFTYILFGLACVIGVVANFVAEFLKSKDIAIMISMIGYGMSLIMLVPFILMLVSVCSKCGYYGTKYMVNSSDSTGEHIKYVSGGYKHTTYDIKDASGNKLGKIENKEYEDGYYTTEVRTTRTTIYKCSHCGKEYTSTENISK